MLEILYDTDTKEVRAWNADEAVQGNLKPKEGQEIIIFDVEPPIFESDIYYVDLIEKKIASNLDYIPEPTRDLPAEIDVLKAKVAELEKKDG